MGNVKWHVVWKAVSWKEFLLALLGIGVIASIYHVYVNPGIGVLYAIGNGTVTTVAGLILGLITWVPIRLIWGTSRAPDLKRFLVIITLIFIGLYMIGHLLGIYQYSVI